MQCLGDGDVSTVYRRAILTIVTVLVNPTADDLLRLMVILYKGALAGFYHHAQSTGLSILGHSWCGMFCVACGVLSKFGTMAGPISDDVGCIAAVSRFG